MIYIYIDSYGFYHSSSREPFLFLHIHILRLSAEITEEADELVKRIYVYLSLFIFVVKLREREELNPIQFTTLITDIKRSSPPISLGSISPLYLSAPHSSRAIKLKS